jgi:hypothetical protein
MKIEWQKGNSNLAGILIIIFIIIVVITTPRDGESGWNWTPGSTITSGNYGFSDSPSGSGSSAQGTISGQTITSNVSGADSIHIGSGNAAYSYQSYEEYITIDNNGRSPVNITGWQLKNGKDQRPYLVGSSLQRFSADIALIPQATSLLMPYGNSVLQDVVLERNERAIVTTGSVGSRSPYSITSFKENSCTGYIEDLPDYSFNPPLNRNCPRPFDEPGIENLDIECRKAIQNISPCETPVYGGKDQSGENCPDCLDGKILGSACNAFIKERFSYQGCLINHSRDEGFAGRTWRIFLGRGWEMWAKEYESIELFDRFGQLVTFQNY